MLVAYYITNAYNDSLSPSDLVISFAYIAKLYHNMKFQCFAPNFSIVLPRLKSLNTNKLLLFIPRNLKETELGGF
jgi:hypothetical protein